MLVEVALGQLAIDVLGSVSSWHIDAEEFPDNQVLFAPVCFPGLV